ncbi:MAG: type III-A CRISPR-associated RAMP protein Csm3 [Anaerolineales bacterium]|nr:type III-A CRISPR-associated RAMP protein Csm3 [Anaerolineales bacterium]
MTDINLYGRVIITANIKALTGLHIGGSGTGLEIGGVDKAVIRNSLTKQPYIPGSSLRGKMRSQTEKRLGKPQNNPIGQQVKIHTCKKQEEYKANGGCVVCHVFGVPAEIGYSGPTRLVVRDVSLTKESVEALDSANTELRYAEIKTEVAIDRVTSAATPRNLERVPAGAVFGPAELVFGIYEPADYTRLKTVIEAMQLVEDDYLGGSGSRGSGKVRFEKIKVEARGRMDYSNPKTFQSEFESVQALADSFDELKKWLEINVPAE